MGFNSGFKGLMGHQRGPLPADLYSLWRSLYEIRTAITTKHTHTEHFSQKKNQSVVPKPSVKQFPLGIAVTPGQIAVTTGQIAVTPVHIQTWGEPRSISKNEWQTDVQCCQHGYSALFNIVWRQTDRQHIPTPSKQYNFTRSLSCQLSMEKLQSK